MNDRFNDLESSFVNLLVRGVPPIKAGESLGITPELSVTMSQDPAIFDAVQRTRSLYEKGVGPEIKINFTRDDAALMYFEAHRKSATSTEEVKAIDSLVKLYGLNAPEKKEVEVRTGSLADFERLDAAQLIELSGTEVLLDPKDYVNLDTE